MHGMTPTFRSLEWLNEQPIRLFGQCAVVQLDQQTNDFMHLINKEVQVDGRLFRCTKVERYEHGAPWQPGEHIALLLTELGTI